MIDYPNNEGAGAPRPTCDLDAPPTPHGRDTVDRSVAEGGLQKSARIDLGLDLMRLWALPGEHYSATEIAAWCGCSSERIHQIERRALRKVRTRFKHADEMREYFAERARRQDDHRVPRAK